ncbi:TetR/AcrR family transcriptional regulator [Microtetraspora fusca]|uniref:TetR/AcrR family transcriptional regulator n=1 Tax=Microtetraspora fusca TaxID=1997 RepID=UPI00082F1815|nr:TetR/AcrR family transcriptional regulator [Microtetraspora fusca]
MSDSNSTRWPARSAAKAATRAALIEAVREIAKERGYLATSVEAVAERAGVTTGSIYSIFGGKRQLFTQAFDEINRLPRLTDAAPLGTPMIQALEAFGLHWADMTNQPTTKTALDLSMELRLTARGDSAIEADSQRRYGAQMQELADELTRYAAAAGESLPIPAIDLARMLAATLGGFALARVQTGEPRGELFGYAAACLWTGRFAATGGS